MSQISGHNYIGGAYSAAGDTVLQSFDAVTGRRWTASSSRRPVKRSMLLPWRRARRIRRTAAWRRRAVPVFLRRLPQNSMLWTEPSLTSFAAKPHYPLHASKVNAAVPATSCACLPKCCVAVTSMARESTAPCPSANPCHGPTCVSAASVSGRWPCLVPAISPGVFHCRWRHRSGTGGRLPGGVQSAQRAHAHQRLGGGRDWSGCGENRNA